MSQVRKALAALVTGMVGWVTAVLNSAPDNITTTEWILLATVLSAAALVYLVPNDA